ncbi:MAG: hypothetical protein MHM6MM_004311 [Cercozoa sp. M6MM]
MDEVIRAVVSSSALAAYSYRKRSLDLSGAVAAFVVGALILWSGQRFGLALLAFFASSSKLTKVGAKQKKRIEEDYASAQCRNAWQVLANSYGAAVCSLIYKLTVPEEVPLSSEYAWSTQLQCAFVAFFACCAGDTWSSELGVLSSETPRLITAPWRKVPAGTNGGVTLAGLLAAALAGLFVSMSFALCNIDLYLSATWLLLGVCAGLGGSLLDSVLGATLEFSGWDEDTKMVTTKKGTQLLAGRRVLTGGQVNALSATIMSLLAFAVAPRVFN